MELNFKKKMFSWMPKHFREGDYELYIDVMALAFQDLKARVDEIFQETRISEATTEFLNIHGRERGMKRVVYAGNMEESDEHFANRVRRIKYNRTKENIIDNVRSVINLTKIEVRNDLEDGSFLEGVQDKRALTVNLGGISYGNYGPLDLKLRHNCFSVFIETPVPPPLAFYDDSHFFDDGSFMDQRERILDDSIIDVIKTLVKQKAPAGSGFRVLVREFSGISIGNEAAQEAELNRIEG